MACIHLSMFSNSTGIPIQPPTLKPGFLGFPGHRVDGLDAGAPGHLEQWLVGFNNLFNKGDEDETLIETIGGFK